MTNNSTETSETKTSVAKAVLVREAMDEAMRRYGPAGDVEGALLFFIGANATFLPLTEEDMKRATDAINEATSSE